MTIRLSASLIKDVLTCTQRGYYRVNRPELSIETPEMALGTVVHNSIEKYWNDQELAVEYVNSEAGRREVNQEKAVKFVNNYFQFFRTITSKEDEIEKFFELKYKDDVVIVGKLDRVNPELGFIIDWKTTANPPTTIDNDIQFILYHYAYTRLYGKEPNLVGYASLTKGKLIKYNKNKFIYENFFERVIPRVIGILKANNYSRDGVFDYYQDKYKGSMNCFYCSFKDACLNLDEDY